MTKRSGCLVLALATAMGGGTASAGADEKPLWELGLGLGGLSFPVYRGADQRQGFAVPAPYLVYRGDVLKADRRGVRGELAERGAVEFDISATASPPAASDEVKVRRGMPDLRATLGIGPNIDWLWWSAEGGRRALRFQVPVHGMFTLQSSSRFVGWQAVPRLNLDVLAPGGFDGWNFGLLAGPVFGSTKQHAYLYSVAPIHAEPGRPAYTARSGYGGFETLASWSKRFPSYWFGMFLRYDRLNGATFSDSPLVRRQEYLAGGLAIAWMIGESDRKVTAGD